MKQVAASSVIYSSETSVDFEQTAQCYIPEDRTVLNHRSKIAKSDTVLLKFVETYIPLCAISSLYITTYLLVQEIFSKISCIEKMELSFCEQATFRVNVSFSSLF
jgi:hypothetical protein